MILTTSDSHKISVSHLKDSRDEVIVLAHGFYNNKDVYLFREMAAALHDYYDVLSFDFRGHGKSDGLFSWTHHETKDLRTVVSYAKDQGYKKIGVIGFSLGAAVTLIEASQNRNISSVIAVSAPYDLWKIDFRFWEPEMLKDLKLNLGMKGKGKFIRPGNPFLVKLRPIDVVDRISPTPCLFIHGKKDWLIKPYHSERLFEKALEPKKLTLCSNVGHAEKIFDDNPHEFITACTEWLDSTLRSCERQPERGTE